MRETKDQTIERLEKVIDNQKNELSEIKKERKRLNYAVERLEREIQKALLKSTPYDSELICEYTDQLQEQKKLNEELKAIITEKEKVIADKEERYNTLLSQFNEKKADENEIRKQIWGDKKAFEQDTIKRIIEKIVLTWDGMYRQSREDREHLEKFNNGEHYYSDLMKGYPIHINAAMFSVDTLIIGINPNNGRELSCIDKYAISYYLKFCYEQLVYKKALNELEKFKAANPNCTNDKLAEWTYHKGMELLPLYRDKIF